MDSKQKTTIYKMLGSDKGYGEKESWEEEEVSAGGWGRGCTEKMTFASRLPAAGRGPGKSGKGTRKDRGPEVGAALSPFTG